MHIVLNVLLRLLLLAAGLIFAASLALAFVLLLAAWALRAGWAKLTGRPVSPFVLRVHPQDAFERMYRRAQQGSRTPRADSVRPSRGGVDVTDVEPRQPGG